MRMLRLCSVLSLLSMIGVGAEAQEVIRGPYLQTGAEHEVIVRWRTDVATDSRVQYGVDVGELNDFVADSALVTEHIVQLDGLDSGTAYFYSVGTSDGMLVGDEAGYVFHTSPSIGSEERVRIWAIGDSGTGDDNARGVRDAYLGYEGGAGDVWLMLGDNAYAFGDDDDYQAMVFDVYPEILRSTVLWPVLGNHDGFDADSDTESGGFYDVFSLPRDGQAGGVASGTEAFYSFDYGNIHFVCMDSYDTSRDIGSAMLTWLSDDLASTDQAWLIGVWHHPPYSKGHNSDTEVWSIEMRERVLPMLEAAGVDLVLTAHSHSYERTGLIDGHYGHSSTFDPATMVIDGGDGQADGDGVYAKASAGLAAHEGTVYVVTGNAGRVDKGAYDHAANIVNINELGSMVIDVEGTRLDAVMLDSSGVVLDRFTITKGEQGCAADIVVDGNLNFFDVSAFLVAFGKQEALADFTGDGAWNFFDVSAFLVAFNKGCP